VVPVEVAEVIAAVVGAADVTGAVEVAAAVVGTAEGADAVNVPDGLFEQAAVTINPSAAITIIHFFNIIPPLYQISSSRVNTPYRLI